MKDKILLVQEEKRIISKDKLHLNLSYLTNYFSICTRIYSQATKLKLK